MAKSGSFYTNGYSSDGDSIKLKFEWSVSSQSVANNQTTISWKLVGSRSKANAYVKAGGFKVVIDGETVYNKSTDYRIQLYNGTIVASGTKVLTHKDDGTRSFSASAEGAIYAWSVNCTGSGTFTIDTIARASQPSCITWPEHTQDVGYFGDTIAIHMNRKSSTFTHTVRYEFGSLSGTIAQNVTNGCEWTIPLSFMDLIYATTTGSGTIYVDTYNGTTKVGTKYCGFTAVVPASVKPTCTIQVLDDTNIQDTYGNLVKGLSKLYVKTNFYGAYSSPVKAYNVTANGVKYSAAEIVTGVLTKAGTTTVTATVTDKRGRTSNAASASFPVLDYSAPSVNALSIRRCDQDGTLNYRGEYACVTFSAFVVALNNKNTATYTVKYKKASESAWTSLATDVNGNKVTDLNGQYTVTDASFVFAADGDSPYDVEVSVADRHYTSPRITSVSTAFTLINFAPSGNSLTFGGVYEGVMNTFQNNLDFVQRGNSYTLTSVGVDGQAGFIRMAEITIRRNWANAPIVFEFIQRGRNTPMVVNVLFQTANSTNPGLQTIWYEGTNYDAYLTQTAESVWDLYVKKTDLYDSITLSRWYTSKYMTDRVSVTFPGDLADTVPLGLQGYYHATPVVMQSIIDCLLPVGMIIQLYSHADPNRMYPGTTWVRIENTFLWGCDSRGTIGETGGEKSHTLTVAELPTHTHGAVYSGNVDATKTHAWLASGGSAMAYGAIETGGGAAHNNLPPYTQVSIWRRTA